MQRGTATLERESQAYHKIMNVPAKSLGKHLLRKIYFQDNIKKGFVHIICLSSAQKRNK